VPRFAKAKDPGTLAFPPFKTESDSDWPLMMPIAVGQDVTAGVALETVTVTFVFPEEVTVV
jgi:hypothetical protein